MNSSHLQGGRRPTRLHRLAAGGLALFLLAPALGSCVKHESFPVGLSSFKVTIDAVCRAGGSQCQTGSAVNLGTPTLPIDDAYSEFHLSIQAIGSDGNPFPFNGQAKVRLDFSGNLTPPRTALPCSVSGTPPEQAVDCARGGTSFTDAGVQLSNGAASVSVLLPQTYGETEIWVEDAPPCGCGKDEYVNSECVSRCQENGSFSYAVGVAGPFYKRHPTIPDLQYTQNPSDVPLDGKHVILVPSAGERGLVVTGVTSGGFFVTDPAATQWNSVFVYSYNQPRSTLPDGTFITLAPGMLVSDINGDVQPFHGWTELGFPIWNLVDGVPDLSRIPPPVPISEQMLADPLKMKAQESSLVSVEGWVVCKLDPQQTPTPYDYQGWTQYRQWKIAPPDQVAADCTCADGGMSVETNATVPQWDASFDPVKGSPGIIIPHIQGNLKHVNPSGDFHLWILAPRWPDDFPVPAGGFTRTRVCHP